MTSAAAAMRMIRFMKKADDETPGGII
jgi:hypothetical protein